MFMGVKRYVDDRFYELARACGLEPNDVDAAIEQLHDHGVIDARFAGGRPVVELLSAGRRFVTSTVIGGEGDRDAD